MGVVDASVIIELVAEDLDLERLGDEELAAPHLIDSGVVDVRRRLVHHGELAQGQGGRALHHFIHLELTRCAADLLRARVWELRHDVSACDATCDALTEALGATSLLTTHARLAAAPGVRCTVEVLWTRRRRGRSTTGPGTRAPVGAAR